MFNPVRFTFLSFSTFDISEDLRNFFGILSLCRESKTRCTPLLSSVAIVALFVIEKKENTPTNINRINIFNLNFFQSKSPLLY